MRNATRVLGADSDVPALSELMGQRSLAMAVIGQALFDQLIGGVYSAIPADELPEPDARPAFAERIRQSLPPDQHFTEDVAVSVLVGRLR
ncbi:hypothetical protein [Streptomyces aureocirculatus]|uniref:hypothetical protein n=1 Tax=Streptomyces aureocirculatus TaxID=67275 RepID=UPI0004CBCF97|nr:hypothetical protein [Streptomyces aureocirculatus]